MIETDRQTDRRTVAYRHEDFQTETNIQRLTEYRARRTHYDRDTERPTTTDRDKQKRTDMKTFRQRKPYSD